MFSCTITKHSPPNAIPKITGKLRSLAWWWCWNGLTSSLPHRGRRCHECMVCRLKLYLAAHGVDSGLLEWKVKITMFLLTDGLSLLIVLTNVAHTPKWSVQAAALRVHVPCQNRTLGKHRPTIAKSQVNTMQFWNLDGMRGKCVEGKFVITFFKSNLSRSSIHETGMRIYAQSMRRTGQIRKFSKAKRSDGNQPNCRGNSIT